MFPTVGSVHRFAGLVGDNSSPGRRNETSWRLDDEPSSFPIPASDRDRFASYSKRYFRRVSGTVVVLHDITFVRVDGHGPCSSMLACTGRVVRNFPKGGNLGFVHRHVFQVLDQTKSSIDHPLPAREITYT